MGNTFLSIHCIFLIICFISKVYCFSEECVHIGSYNAAGNTGHTVICSKLYHGIWTIPMANPVVSFSGAPCRTACYSYDQCGLATQCLTGEDGICIFDTNTLKAGNPGNVCPGSGFAMYYICLPLTKFSADVCYGMPGEFCYEEVFLSDGPKLWTIGNQKSGGKLSNNDARAAHKDRLVFTATHVTAAAVAVPGTVLMVTAPNIANWKDYEITANFWSTHPNENVFKASSGQMVGITFRHSNPSNAVSGTHYMAGWLSTGSAKSAIGVYQWSAGSYKRVSKCNNVTAALPANSWVAMRVVVQGNKLTVSTNKCPLVEYELGCSQIPRTDNDPVNCCGMIPAIECNLDPLDYLEQGTAGLYFAGGQGFSDDFSVRRLSSLGTCGDGTCSAADAENCINCAEDCPAPCGCGDGVCAGDHEAKGCRDDCFQCVVKYLNPVKNRWFTRPDNIALLYSFDNRSAMGFDNSLNGVDLIKTEQEWTTTGCAPGANRQRYDGQPNGCAQTKANAPFFLLNAEKMYGKLPVASCDMTIAFFATVSRKGTSTYAVRWGNLDVNRAGLQSRVEVNYGTTGLNGFVRWYLGLHSQKVDVNWRKPGLRHIVLTYDRIRQGTAEPCSKKRVPQMVTFGKLQVGSFDGILDDLVIASDVWDATKIAAHLNGAPDISKPPDTINLKPEDIVFPTPRPIAPTPMPTIVTTTESTTLGSQTLPPRWVAPTPPVRSCRELCVEQCKPSPFLSCACAHEYARPTEVACDAVRAAASLMIALSVWLTMFLL